MSDGLPIDEVARAARLARLSLTPDEQRLFARQLSDVLAYVDQVQAVETGGVPPMSHPHVAGTAERDDEARPSIDRDAVLEAAPDADRAAGVFKVPRVLAP